MSNELKTYRFMGMDEVWPNANVGSDYYLESEADKVIAEKDAEIAELQKQVHDYAQGLYLLQARAEKEARHDKRKRCLAMAKWCYTMDCMMLETAQKKMGLFSKIRGAGKGLYGMEN